MKYMLLVATLTLLSSPTPCSPLSSSCTPSLPDSLSSCSNAHSEQSERWQVEGKSNPEAHWKMGIETSRHQPNEILHCGLLLSDAFVILRRAWWFQLAMFFLMPISKPLWNHDKSTMSVWRWCMGFILGLLHLVLRRIAAVCSGVSSLLTFFFSPLKCINVLFAFIYYFFCCCLLLLLIDWDFLCLTVGFNISKLHNGHTWTYRLFFFFYFFFF